MISILMPIYNGLKYLEESFASIKKQSFESWELLIGINGHKSNLSVINKTKEIIDKHPQVKIFNYSFAGKSKTLNSLCKEAQYNWVALLDVDDLWLPNKLEEQFQFANQYDVIGTHCQYFDSRTGQPKLPKYKLDPIDFLKENPIINSSCLLKKEISYWDESMDLLEDYDLWLRLNLRGCSFYNIPKNLTLHRIHKDSFFNNDNRQDLVKEKLLEEYRNKLKEKELIPQKRGIIRKLISRLQRCRS